MTMSSDFFFRNKIPVAVLGATGYIGQRFVQRLSQHPWFEIVALCASEQSDGKLYGSKWTMPTSLPESISNLTIQPCRPPLEAKLIFSALPQSLAAPIEALFAEEGYVVLTVHESVNGQEPVVGEINSEFLSTFTQKILFSPRPLSVGLALILKPLSDQFGLENVQVALNQSEESNQQEDQQKQVTSLKFPDTITGQMNTQSEIAVGTILFKLKKSASSEEIIEAWRAFRGEPQRLRLPSAPFRPLYYFEQLNDTHFQSDLSNVDKEMAIYLEHLQDEEANKKITFFFSLLQRGIVGNTLINAELLVSLGKIYW